MKRNQWRAILFAAVVFGCGVISGILSERYLLATVVNAKTSEDFRQQYISEMRAKLNLSDAQLSKLDVILDETKAQFKSLRDQYRPDVDKIKDQQVERVKAILDSSQVAGYEQLVADRERRFKDQEKKDREDEQARAALHRSRLGQK